MSEVDVHVERCVLRIRRASGWSWGSAPDALIRAASRAIPALLARHLGALAALDRSSAAAGDRELDALRVTVPVTLDELVALGHAAAGDATGPARGAEVRLANAVALAIGGAPLEVRAAATASAPAPAPEDPGFARAPEPAGAAMAIARVLAVWAAAGQHVAGIARTTLALARAWRGALEAAAPPDARGTAAEPPAEIDAIAGEGELAALPTDTHAWLAIVAPLLGARPDRASIARAVGVARGWSARARAHRGADRVDEVAAAVASPRAAAAEEEGVQPGEPAAGTAEAIPARAATCRATTDVDIACALPFLALVPLARAGWLAALDAAATALDARELLPAIAEAFAHRLLAPPARAWHRSTAATTAAAAFAGLATAPSNALRARRRLLDEHLAQPLAATARAALVAGHERGAPVIAHAGREGGHHLLERRGLFALAWSASPRELATTLDELVLVPGESAAPELLDALDLANRRFVAAAAATRGEAWRRLPRGLCTNDTVTPADRLAALAGGLEDLGLLARELDEAISDRPGLPRAAASPFERSLALAAVLALGDLSWTLFRAREVATPVLALQRFADLGAHVSFGAEEVRVRLPLGRRHADLFAHHYTGEVRDVPWLDGRVVEICGG